MSLLDEKWGCEQIDMMSGMLEGIRTALALVHRLEVGSRAFFVSSFGFTVSFVFACGCSRCLLTFPGGRHSP